MAGRTQMKTEERRETQSYPRPATVLALPRHDGVNLTFQASRLRPFPGQEERSRSGKLVPRGRP